jgi:hypothetical protein
MKKEIIIAFVIGILSNIAAVLIYKYFQKIKSK